ncbi:MAG: thiamine diphosphokinase [Syntrophomonadaceae bacterium]|jgi:thiamine pyrophosphokinase|nr:thiamine diphosphokinase [Syntrophomonadaceae bacterium]
MKCLVMVNGFYGQLNGYKERIKKADSLWCVDGGANYAYQMQIVPDIIVGDMDSILPRVYDHYKALGVDFRQYPRKKDYTDTQLAISLISETGFDDITFLGSLGNRLDHTLANIYCGMEFCEKGGKIEHYNPDYSVFLVKDQLTLQGNIGDLVSVLALTEKATGVFEAGFEYPLENAVLYKKNPYAVSNVMQYKEASISIKEGIILIFHYRLGNGGKNYRFL